MMDELRWTQGLWVKEMEWMSYWQVMTLRAMENEYGSWIMECASFEDENLFALLKKEYNNGGLLTCDFKFVQDLLGT